MHIEWSTVAHTVPTLVTALVAVAGLVSGPGALRSRLRHDVELLEHLPSDSDAHATLLQLINDQVAKVASLERDARRDWQGGILAGLMALGLGWLCVYLFDLGDWWWRIGSALSAVSALACLSIMFDDLQRLPRDEKGKRL